MLHWRSNLLIRVFHANKNTLIRKPHVLFCMFHPPVLSFQILGIAGTVFAIWMLVDPAYSLSVTQDYVISVVIILIASLLLIIVAVFGLIGSLRENQCALITFFCLLLIIFVAEVSTGIWVHINRDSIKLHVKNAVEYTVEHEYYQNENRKNIFDTFQRNVCIVVYEHMFEIVDLFL